MATTPYGGTYYPSGGLLPDVPAEMAKMGASLEGRTVMSFPTIAARDAALSTLTTDQRKGVVAFVTGQGWWGYDGSSWKRFMMNGVNYIAGNANVTTDGNGLFSIAHAFGNDPIAALFTNVYGGPAGAAEQVMYQTKLSVRAYGPNGVIGWAGRVDTTSYSPLANAAIIVSYLFIRA